MDNVHEWYSKVFQDILQTYDSKDIYNCDETGIFYKMLPDKSMIFKSESAHGTKSSKERLTVMVASNMTGSDKLPLLVIGKSLKPRCFKNQKSLPTDYLANKNSWMTSEIFTCWIKKLDAKFESEGRTVAMLLDNCSAHPKVSGLAAITLYFLPPNTTSVTQPMDQGIIHNLKCHYRRQLVDKMSVCIAKNESFSVNVLEALHFLKCAWDRVTSETISNCFFKTVTDNAPPTSELPTVTPSSVMDINNFLDYVTIDNESVCTEYVTDERIIASVQNQSETDFDTVETEEDPLKTGPSVATAISMLTDIRLTLGTFENAQPHFGELNSMIDFLERNRVKHATQKTITDFFAVRKDEV